jgi:hypothetical protein
MKCGICGNTERIMFETNFNPYGKDYQKKDSNGEPIKQLNDDGSVRMRPIRDASDMTEHKRFEHPAEVEALARKRQETKRANAQLKEAKTGNRSKIYRAGQEAVSVPVLDYHQNYQYLRVGRWQENPYELTTSRTGGYDSDNARRIVLNGQGDEAVRYNGGHEFRQITEEDVTELTTLDKAIKDLQEQRNAIAAQMYERGLELTYRHLADLGDAATAAQDEYERMLHEGDELDANDEGRLTDDAVENIVEAAMANQPTKFIAYSEEQIAEALGAYGYTASAEVVRSRGFDRGY